MTVTPGVAIARKRVLKQATLEGLKREIDDMVETVKKVVHQTKARVFGGDTHVEGKILSVFETSTEVIRKGKASKPTEFGKMVKIQEAENPATGRNRQIVIDFQVYDQKPSDSDLLIPSMKLIRRGWAAHPIWPRPMLRSTRPRM